MIERKPSDNGHTNKQTGLFNYIALPYPLPAEYQAQLVQLGNACNKLVTHKKDAEAYEEAQAQLYLYEQSLRRQFGVRVERPEFKPRKRIEACFA